jgi:hypothetical protein
MGSARRRDGVDHAGIRDEEVGIDRLADHALPLGEIVRRDGLEDLGDVDLAPLAEPGIDLDAERCQLVVLLLRVVRVLAELAQLALDDGEPVDEDVELLQIRREEKPRLGVVLLRLGDLPLVPLLRLALSRLVMGDAGEVVGHQVLEQRGDLFGRLGQGHVLRHPDRAPHVVVVVLAEVVTDGLSRAHQGSEDAEGAGTGQNLGTIGVTELHLRNPFRCIWLTLLGGWEKVVPIFLNRTPGLATPTTIFRRLLLSDLERQRMGLRFRILSYGMIGFSVSAAGSTPERRGCGTRRWVGCRCRARWRRADHRSSSSPARSSR